MVTSADFGQSLTREELLVADALCDVRDEDSMWAIGTEACDLVTRLHAKGQHVCVGDGCPDESHGTAKLPEKAPTRGPKTSDEAAEAIADLSDRHRSVLIALREIGPATDRTLAERYDPLREARPDLGLVQQRPASIRSRRHELAEARHVRFTGRKVTLPTGRKAMEWEAVR